MQGKVLKSVGKNYSVQLVGGQILNCTLRGLFRQKGIKSTNPVVVGDQVQITQEGDTGIITKIEPRSNAIVRKSVNLSKQIHVLAANVDQAVLVVTMRAPRTSLEFIDRFLVSAGAFGVPVTLLVNKLDQINQKTKLELAELMEIYESTGYKVVLCSATTPNNLQEVADVLGKKTSVFVGHSGVGKSTLLNYFSGSTQKVEKVSDQHDQGQHTTTFAEMFALDNGGYLIDTPGIKGLGLVEINKEELSNYFPEFFQLKADCKYHNCVHINEPGCAIKRGIEAGEIASSRYRSYLRIYSSEENQLYR